MKFPILLVIAGPNGSGKSSVISENSQFKSIGDYVNADEIQRHLKCTALDAAVIAENTREYLFAEHKSFTFETVLSTERNIDLMERAKRADYRVICVYITTINPEINIYRVGERVKKGLHDVPPEKVKERYWRAMKLFPRLFDICDELYVFDNSIDRNEGEPSMILKWQFGNLATVPNAVWSEQMIEKLCKGVFA